MRAAVYGLQPEGAVGAWEFRFSIAWKVDRHYWQERGAAGLIRLAEEVPLGVAEQICDRLKVEQAIDRLKVEQEGGWGEKRARDELSRVAREVWAEGNARFVEIMTLFGKFGKGSESLDERVIRLAREIGERLSGRSLLEDEALQLLGEVREVGGSAVSAGSAGSVGNVGDDYLAALQLAALEGAVRLTAAVAPAGAAPPRRRSGWGRLRASRRRSAAEELRCRRCGSGNESLRRTPCAACGGHACAYCEACVTMGRSRACGLLVIGAAPLEAGAPAWAPAAAHPLGRWSLSPAQREAAAAALRFLGGDRGEPAARRHNNKFLLWAVTGAGKTEMIFPLLEAILSRGGRALVATPRRDVVLELAPRLAAAFPGYSRAVLYGGSADRWENAALTLATTHQLIRFQEAFDLVLIDEMDAFPYRDDEMLQFAAAKCCRPDGVTLYLSATPPPDMQRAVKRGRLPCARVPVRFHGHPLPVPKRITLPPISRWLRSGKLPKQLLKPFRASVLRGAQLFVFVPMIRYVDPLVRLLRKAGPSLGIDEEAQIEGTSSKDALRADKVSGFRERSIRVLITTTILERGVTIPKSDVIVLDADDALFDAAALVQMAGRAGRSAADPNGAVTFAGRNLTQPQRGAIRQIRGMNKIAAKQGYLQTPAEEASIR